MKKNLILGVAISTLFLYFSVRDIDWSAVAKGFSLIRYGWLMLSVVALVLLQVGRSYRWGVLLEPIQKVDQHTLFSVTNVGCLALVALPARIGELARPYLIRKKTGMRMTAALGTVFVERVLDGLTVLSFLFMALFFMSLPAWLLEAAAAFLLFTLVTLVCLLLLIFRREVSLRVFASVTRILPERWDRRLNELIHHFIDGIEMITDIKLVAYATFLSLLIWLLDIAAIYSLFLAFGMPLSIMAAIIVMVVLVIGITIPTAPGYVGNWHFFCRLGLIIFGVTGANALAYAIMLHFISVGVIVILGLIYLPSNRFHLSDLSRGAVSEKL